MLLHLLKLLSGRSAVLAMLCKTTVARKVLQHAWERHFHISNSILYRINTFREFGATVDSCLLVCILTPQSLNQECIVYRDLKASKIESKFALFNGRLIANLEAFEASGHLLGNSPIKWRSGIKHDCSQIMELRPVKGDKFENGLGDRIYLESTFLFPMLKSSELMKSRLQPGRYMLVTQRSVGEDTFRIKQEAPNTWAYLQAHADRLDKRASSIYRRRPRFSIFGVGPYSFANWKVAISGFYKKINFRCINTLNGKPIMLDDTCYFLPFRNESDARNVKDLLSSETADKFFRSLIFWDAKRPITAQILASLDLAILAKELDILLPQDEFTSEIASKYNQSRLDVLFD